MVNVFLDDLRPCPKGFKLVKTVSECIQVIEKNNINILSLDHDLGFGRPSGFEVVKYIVNNKIFPREIIIHTANPFGRIRMFRLLNSNMPKNVKVVIRPEPLYL
ncbi:cyclic-phosphate processing receiver domain-containing protein [Paenibacillus sp. FSL H7-0331]|uniref:cyclic-phosphate processing receiver domain-containing protein n=1 Tax=Paenibacillus sp. FSL H7-0331 TaxID=1920421 RepID=UPI00096ECF9D|nr:cyclic-phosphate processing receiver domain-containing protein [Paenibacillus sp. FSL H7-0331]OME97907.1 hypothetical protein BK127_40015 [Paenibacillus sp. FSL H7-0331]